MAKNTLPKDTALDLSSPRDLFMVHQFSLSFILFSLPSQSDGEAADVEVHRHYKSENLKGETEWQRGFCRWKSQSKKL